MPENPFTDPVPGLAGNRCAKAKAERVKAEAEQAKARMEFDAWLESRSAVWDSRRATQETQEVLEYIHVVVREILAPDDDLLKKKKCGKSVMLRSKTLQVLRKELIQKGGRLQTVNEALQVTQNALQSASDALKTGRPVETIKKYQIESTQVLEESEVALVASLRVLAENERLIKAVDLTSRIISQKPASSLSL